MCGFYSAGCEGDRSLSSYRDHRPQGLSLVGFLEVEGQKNMAGTRGRF